MRALSLATVFAALSGFVVIYVASWALGNDEFAAFQAYWGLFFAATGFLDGIMQETTRGVSSARDTGRSGTGHPWRLAAVIGGTVLVAALVIGFFWMPALLRGHAPTGMATAFLAFGLLTYAFQAVLSGVLSGLGLWRRYAGLVALDSGVRLFLALVAWQLGWGMPAFLIITVIGALSWLVILLAGGAVRPLVDVAHPELARRVTSAMLATGASAALITGFPVFVQTTSTPDAGTYVTVAGIINAVTLTRAPILVPLQRFQSALIVRFVEKRGRLYSALLAPIGAVLGLGVLGAVAAWLIGPWILETFFKDGLQVPGLILAVLTFASACTGSLMVTGAATLASELHRAYVLGWVAASVVAFGVLWLAPLSLEAGVCTALVVGPVAGGLVHVLALRRAAGGERSASENVT
jgi:O-antigen/teichoic acid export membrane protein